jgi:hypothetical protein
VKHIIKIVLSLAVTLTLSTNTHAVLVKLPSAEVLKQSISKIASKHFVEKTKIHTVLGDKEREAVTIVLAVEMACDQYLESFESNEKKAKIKALINKRAIIITILEGHDAAIKELFEIGALG